MKSAPGHIRPPRGRRSARRGVFRPALILALLAVLALASGCAVKPLAPRDDKAQAVWSRFRATYASSQAAAFSLSASISFSAGIRSGRVNARFHGNYALPLRLDLQTPLGQPLAFWREDASAWMAYYPDRDTVYRHREPRSGMDRLGLALPFSLRELAAVATGRFGEFIPDRYRKVEPAKDGFTYTLDGDPRLASLTLDLEGNPRHLAGRGLEPWSVAFEEYAPSPGAAHPVARAVVLTTPGGNTIRLRVKQLELMAAPYPEKNLELPVPVTATAVSLEKPGAIPPPGF